MTRKVCALLGLLIAFVSFLYVPQAPTQETKWKKTVTLTSGEVILDISGEWDVFVENYGSWSSYGSYPQKVNITQELSFFVGTRMISDPFNSTGTVQQRGVLAKSGIKKVTIMSAAGPLDAKGEISENGDKMIIDASDKARLTLTRKFGVSHQGQR